LNIRESRESDMEDLRALLDESGVDASSLRELFGTPDGAVYALTRPGAEAEAAWFALREAVGGRGWWPVLLGSEAGLDRIAEDMAFNLEGTSPRAVLARSLEVDVDAWLAERETGEWPDEAEWEAAPTPIHNFTATSDVLSGVPLDRVTIALVPAASWEVAAWLGIGGWNECPSPHEHVALHRRWHERYGAEVASYTGDVVELYVTRPVADEAEAEAVAREHYIYCYDVVDQGCGTMEVLAGSILGATVWYFWWD
jgi:hypothetical protein